MSKRAIFLVLGSAAILITVQMFAVCGSGDAQSLQDLDGIVSDNEYEFKGSFGDDTVIIHWRVVDDAIRMAIQGRTMGWVSIGIDYDTMMEDSDFIFGWVDPNGTTRLMDSYSSGPTGPHKADTELGGTNDIPSFNGGEKDGITTLEFVRDLDTGDVWDKPIPRDGKIKIIWAIGDEDSFSMHTEDGYGTIDIGTGRTTSRTPVELWPWHAISMIIGAGLFIAGTYSIFQRRWRHFLRFHILAMTTGAAFGGIGLALGYIMVEGSGGVHLRVPHTWLGAVTLFTILSSLLTGLYMRYGEFARFKSPSRKAHVYLGWTGLFFFFLTVITGFYRTFFVNESEADVWFLLLAALALALTIGTLIYLIPKGRRHPIR